MELGCHSKKSGNVQTGDRDDANSVQEFGDWVGDKHRNRLLWIELCRATFRQLKFRTTDGFGAMHIEYSVVGPLTAVWNWWKTVQYGTFNVTANCWYLSNVLFFTIIVKYQSKCLCTQMLPLLLKKHICMYAMSYKHFDKVSFSPQPPPWITTEYKGSCRLNAHFSSSCWPQRKKKVNLRKEKSLGSLFRQGQTKWASTN